MSSPPNNVFSYCIRDAGMEEHPTEETEDAWLLTEPECHLWRPVPFCVDSTPAAREVILNFTWSDLEFVKSDLELHLK
jgi:hypothetical protein